MYKFSIRFTHKGPSQKAIIMHSTATFESETEALATANVLKSFFDTNPAAKAFGLDSSTYVFEDKKPS